jgi:hypothetical protein
MATFTTIPDTDLDADSPITENLMLALRDNPLAIAQGDASAPRVQKEALGALSVGAYLLKTTMSTQGTLTATSTGVIGNTDYTNVPSGRYMIAFAGAVQDSTTGTIGVQFYINGAWRDVYLNQLTAGETGEYGCSIISTGSNVRFYAKCDTSAKATFAYLYYSKLDN